MLIGNGLVGFFKPICARVLNSSLSTFGWVCNWIPRVSLLSICTLMRPIFSSEIRRVIKPDNSNCCRPPSRPIRTLSLSSNLMWTLEVLKCMKRINWKQDSRTSPFCVLRLGLSSSDWRRWVCRSYTQSWNLLTFALQLIYKTVDILWFASQFQCVPGNWFSTKELY